jgi:methylenetetrahydrofolate dehydrogenase (NADP+)/methenyltetrahydrofolate cyclohydrolase
METRRLPGKVVRDAVIAELTAKVKESPRPPGLGVILAGDDPASQVYVRHKTKACQEVGFHQVTQRFGATVAETEILECIESMNRDDRLDGILVQLPLPRQVSAEKALQCVNPTKDVDGFHPESLGLLVAGKPTFIPCTPKGILRLLQHYDISLAGKHVVVVGRSVIVGRPLAMLLSLKRPDANATVTLCHSATRDLESVCQQGDIVVAAIGSPAFLGQQHIAPGAVVIDVGINRIEDPQAKRGTRLVGDVATDALDGWASAYTPVPGGVGPMTIAMLLENTWEAMSRRGGGD